MEWFFVAIGALVALGGGIALYERRHKKTLLAHDFSLKGPQTEADREAERSAQAIREAHLRNQFGGHH